MRLDYWNYPILTERKIRRIAEDMIPTHLRLYYVGADIMKCSYLEDWAAWNCDIELLFKAPVVNRGVDGVRYAHASLEDMKSELNDSLEIDFASIGDEEYAEYDESISDRAVVEISALKKPIEWKAR